MLVNQKRRKKLKMWIVNKSKIIKLVIIKTKN
jgi:hypothetical protein